jgi:hypothetical protein
MIELVDVNDGRAVRNKDNILGFYDLMINKKKSEEAVSKFVVGQTSNTTGSFRMVPTRWGSSSARSPRNAPRPALLSTASSPSATMVISKHF